MKTQTLILLVVVIAASVIAINCDPQDADCRKIGTALMGNSELIDRVPRFRLYGYPPRPKTCQDRCDEVNKSQYETIGFSHYGQQACCCGVMEKAAA